MAQQEGFRQGAVEGRARAKIHAELGAAYFQAGNPGVALDELSIAIEADKTYPTAYSIRGLVLSSLKEISKAEADFAKALELAPGDPEVNNNYGWFLCESARPARAIPYFLQAIKSPLYETPERAYANAGSCAMKAGDSVAALSYLLKALQFSKDAATLPRFLLAKLFYQDGKFDEAKIYLTEVLNRVDTPSAEMLWLAARLERRLGNRNAESIHVGQLRSRFPTSTEYLEYLKGNFE